MRKNLNIDFSDLQSRQNCMLPNDLQQSQYYPEHLSFSQHEKETRNSVASAKSTLDFF